MVEYKTYKDSGVSWIGKVPSEWSSTRLRYYLSLEKGRTPSSLSVSPNGNLPYLTMDYLRGRDEKTTQYPIEVEGLRLVNEGDILVLWDGANAGEITRAKSGYLSSTMALIGYDRSILSGDFLYFFLKAIEPVLKDFSSGTTIPHFDSSLLLDEPYFIPSKEEQESISNYLCSLTESIDVVIKEKESLLSDLNEYRKKLIGEIVSKGIGDDTSLEQTGISAFGEIPSTWKAVKIKYVLQQDKDGIKIGPFGSSLTNKVTDSGPIKVYGQWNIVDKNFLNGKNYVQLETFEELNGYEVIPGDVLVSMMGTVGKCATIPAGIQIGIMDSHVIKIRLNHSLIMNEYFELVYDKDNSNLVFSQINEQKKGSIMDGLTSTIVKNLYIPLPPLNVQQKIVDAVRTRTGIIDKAISAVKQQILDLDEYKASVIFEAVTGKIDVRQ